MFCESEPHRKIKLLHVKSCFIRCEFSLFFVILTLVQTDCISFDPQFGFSTRQLWLRKQSGLSTKVIPQLLQPKLSLMSVCDNVRQGTEKQFLYKIALNAQLEQKSAIKVSVHLSLNERELCTSGKNELHPSICNIK